jgi:hypothetical protein
MISLPRLKKRLRNTAQDAEEIEEHRKMLHFMDDTMNILLIMLVLQDSEILQ